MSVLEKILEEIESTTYPDEGIGCGLEDAGITDRYEASAYGWDEAMELVIEIIKNHMEDDDWIPCSERLPEEHDSMFAKFKGTDKWRQSMFARKSDVVNVTVEFMDGKRKTDSSYTLDGKWKYEKEYRTIGAKVVAWKPLPDTYTEKKGKEQK